MSDVDLSAIHEADLQGPRLRKRRVVTVPVMLDNGEEWQVPGPPLETGEGSAGEAYEKALAWMDSAYRALNAADDGANGTAGPFVGQLDFQRATSNAAFTILRTVYPNLTEPAFRAVTCFKSATAVVKASLSGEAPEDAEPERLDVVKARIAYGLGMLGDAEKPDAAVLARLVVNGTPAEAEAGAEGNEP
ncbi:MAG TPA: hypothetical protein VMW48_00495 [Vicinamibacterales bacterium]|nr:hypothetical protein [Vicinamibacterales bacterium]